MLDSFYKKDGNMEVVSDLDEIKSRNSFYENVNTIINIAAAVLVGWFGFLTIKNLPIVEISPFVEKWIMKIFLFLYFSSLAYGTPSDVSLHRKVYEQINYKWKIEGWMYLVMILMFIFYGVFCYFVENILLFSITFTIFSILDIIGVSIVYKNYLKKVNDNVIEKSIEPENVMAYQYIEKYYNGIVRKSKHIILTVGMALLTMLVILNRYGIINISEFSLKIAITIFIISAEIVQNILRLRANIQFSVLADIKNEKKIKNIIKMENPKNLTHASTL